MSEVNPEPE